MHAWNAHADNLHDIRKSVIPLKPEASTTELHQEDLVLEQAEITVTESTANVGKGIPKKGVKKRANDSVSPLNVHFHTDI